jgi:hemerythrin
MPFFDWVPSYSVGVKELDTQHQKLIGILNQLHDAMKTGKGAQELGGIIQEMVNYTQFHFGAEEKILSSAAYPDYLKQKSEHAAFNRKSLDFQAQYQQGKLAMSVDVLNFLKTWWVTHIQVEDQKYAEHLKKKGLS